MANHTTASFGQHASYWLGWEISMPFLAKLFLAIFIGSRYIHFDLFQIYLILLFYDCRSSRGCILWLPHSSPAFNNKTAWAPCTLFAVIPSLLVYPKCSSITCKNTLDAMYMCYWTCLPHLCCAPWPLTQLWTISPQVLVVIWTCGKNRHKYLWWKTPHVLLSVTTISLSLSFCLQWSCRYIV